MRVTDRFWGGVAVVFGGMLGAGALGELASVVSRDVLPAEVYDIPFMARHHTELGLRAWVFCSNLVNLACALACVRAGILVRRSDASAWALFARGAGGVFMTTLIGMPVCAWYLFPLPVDGELRAASVMLAVSMAGANVGLLTMTGLWGRFSRLRAGA